MDLLFIDKHQTTRLEKLPEKLPEQGFLWMDVVREQNDNWAEYFKTLTGQSIHERHIEDSQNMNHPSFYDDTQQYEMLIFRGLSPAEQTSDFKTRPVVFFIMPHLLVTIRPVDSVSVTQIKPRLLDKSLRAPAHPISLTHILMRVMVDRFLALRTPLIARFDEWRKDLLDPEHPFEDWVTIMSYTSDLRRLERLCEEQINALQMWREDTEVEFNDHISVRFNDLVEHIERISKFATDQRHESESLIQLHFSAVAHRTNEIMRMLTVLSAIFLPLSLIAGIFGMNFKYMPELEWHYAYFFALGGMVALSVILLIIFRIKHWI